MIDLQRTNQAKRDRPVLVGVIGTGHFAMATIAQSTVMPRMAVPIIADLDVAVAKRAYHQAGIRDEEMVVAESRQAALAGMESGQRVIVTDGLLLMDLPLDLIVESTGNPEAGALHAREAIRHGKHVVMVNKEADATVGPILAQMAAEAGVVYTPVDGDQHGLLIGLVNWARTLGLTVLCAGKARDAEYVLDPKIQRVTCQTAQVDLDADELFWLQALETDEIQRYLAIRQSILEPLPQAGGFDLVEMAIAANATGLLPDRPLVQAQTLSFSRRLATDARLTNRGSAAENVRRSSVIDDSGRLHCPPLYTREIPQLLCPRDYGGILEKPGVIDAVTSLRLPHEAGLGGGVFIVVASDNDYVRHILTTKGCLSNQAGTTALIYRPYHLCGVEAPISILNAALLGLSTLEGLPAQLVDVVARTRRDFVAGEIIGNDHSPDLDFLLRRTEPVSENSAENGAEQDVFKENEQPVPIHMANGNRLTVDALAGTLLTRGMIEHSPDSVLWALRQEQDRR